MTKFYALYILMAVTTVMATPAAQAVDIKEDIASAYNEGLVRCGNEACAKYLYGTCQYLNIKKDGDYTGHQFSR